MKKMLLSVLIVTLIVSSTSFGNIDKKSKITDKATIENLKSFTEIYGLIKNFYPAPGRDSINWNDYLAYSVDYIIKNSNNLSSFEIFKKLCTRLFPKVEVSTQKLAKGIYNEAEYFFLRHVGYRQNLTDREALSDVLPINLKQTPQNEAAQNVYISFITQPEVIKNYSSFSIRIPRLISKKDYSAEKALTGNSSFLNEIKNTDKTDLNDSRVQWIGNFIIVWNVYKYFNPYKDDSQLDLEKELDNMMKKMCSVRIDGNTNLTLRELFNKVNDAHLQVYKETPAAVSYLPLRIKKINGKFIISDIYSKTELLPGDEVLEIDKIPVLDEFNNNMKKFSGSTHYVESLALTFMGSRINQEKVEIKVRRTGIKYRMVFNIKTVNSFFNWTFVRKDVEQLSDGIVYINLTKATYASFSKVFKNPSKVKGLIIDFRGYPEDATNIMLHLTKDTIIWSANSTPVIFDPFGKKNSWRFDVMKLPPQSPFYNCPKIFLSESTTQGQPETWLEIVKQYKLGKIAGSNSAGGNGGKIDVDLFGGYVFSFTGTRILDIDGSKIYLKGITPDIIIKENRKVTENQDIVFDEAVKIMKKEVAKKVK